MDVRKTLTDAGYIAVGLGVMGFQQAQVRAPPARRTTSQRRRRLRRRPGPRAAGPSVDAHGRQPSTPKAREAQRAGRGAR